eukprot:8956349-Heterocapsa_arctica.AAC.1
MEDYSRMRDDEPNRSYEWLRFRCNVALEIWRAAGHRRDFAASLKPGRGPTGAAAAQPGKEVCRNFQKTGSCRFGDRC